MMPMLLGHRNEVATRIRTNVEYEVLTTVTPPPSVAALDRRGVALSKSWQKNEGPDPVELTFSPGILR
jgi:hypothetical protein